MGKKIVFASSNKGKISEIQSMLSTDFEVLSSSDIGYTSEIEENGKSFEENAEIKAFTLFEASGIPCFADDSGLEVEALKKKPGIHSARYAGEPGDAKKNNALLLKNLEGCTNRKARFVTVICLKTADKTLFFEGEIKGEITQALRGENGFGYDALFQPEGSSKTFAEMTKDEKNAISHRKRAFEKMLPFLAYI
jgi:XTP/dITP diphosphohydrolase